MKLFCFPHAGGFSSYYNFFRKYKFANVDETILYEYSGRGIKNSEPNDRDFYERVEKAAKELYEFGAESGNYIIFGHSMGSFIGYETARLLSSRYDAQPALVIMSGQNPPCGFCDIKDLFDVKMIDIDLFLKKLGGVPEFLKNCPSALEFYKSFIIEDMEILSGYKGCTPSENEILPFGAVVSGRNDPIVFREMFTKWNKNFLNLVSEKVFEGGHFYMENKNEELCSYIDRIAFKMTYQLRRLKK